MSYVKKNIELLELIKNKIESDSFKKKHRTEGRFFQRDRSLTYVKVFLMILNNISKSLSVEITKFLKNIGSISLVSKQAFSKARYKLKKEAFTDLNDSLIQKYYEYGSYQLYTA